MERELEIRQRRKAEFAGVGPGAWADHAVLKRKLPAGRPRQGAGWWRPTLRWW